MIESTMLALGLEGRDELRRDRLVAGEDQDPRLALDDRVRVGAVVLAERVAGASTTTRKRVEAGLVGLDAERRPGSRPPSRSTRLGADQRAVREQPDCRRLGDARADVGDDLDLLAEPRGRRRREPLDQHLLASPRPIDRVSTWMPRAAARAASRWPRPVVSLPSEIRTIRFWAASGNRADASRSAAPMSVAAFSGVRRSRSISRSSSGSRSTSASLPNATMPAWSPSGIAVEGLAEERQGVLAAGRRRRCPTGRRRTRSRAGRPAARAGSRRGRGRARRAARSDREGGPPAARPIRRRAARCGTNVSRSAGTAGAARSAARTGCPSGAPPGRRRGRGRPRRAPRQPR